MNRELPSLHGMSLEIKLTVPLNHKIYQINILQESDVVSSKLEDSPK